jgi:PAS domain S-box-containing protein
MSSASSRQASDYLELLRVVATAANEATSIEEAMQTAIDAVCALTGWPIGHLYMTSPHDPSVLEPTKVWHLSDPARFHSFREVTEATCMPRGVGLPGRVLAGGRSIWITDVTTDPDFPRARVAEGAGIRVAFAFPVLVASEVVGVLEFFAPEAIEPDERLLRVMADIGAILGRVVERTRAGEALHESELRWRSVTQSAIDAIISADSNGNICSWNRGARLIFGYTEEEVLGKPVSMLMPERYRQEHQAGMERVNTTGQTRMIGRVVELHGLRKDGTEFPLELSLSQWETAQGKFYSGIIRDITRRKQAEEEILRLNTELEERVRQRTAELEGANRQLQSEIAERARIEHDLQVRTRQHEAVAQLGQRALAGADLTTLMDETARMVVQTLGVKYCKILELLPGGQALLLRAGAGWKQGFVGRAVLDSGPASHSGYTLMVGQPVIIEDLHTETRFHPPALLVEHGVVSGLSVIVAGRDQPYGVIGAYTTTRHTFSFNDVNFLQSVANILALAIERKRAEEERMHMLANEQMARAQAEAALRARDELLSVVSHDLKNPLAAIMGNSRLLRRHIAGVGMNKADTLTSVLARIDDAATRMSVLLNELVDFGRLQVGQPLSLQLRTTDLVALTGRVVAEHRQTTGRHSILFESAVPGLIGKWDAHRLERVLSNILSNAIKYSPNGGKIVVRVAEIAEKSEEGRPARHYAMVSVSDPGVGIPEEDLPHVFEWYRRAGNTSGKISGAGIGLASARKIIEQHGGTISVKSEVGRGSTFTIKLPLETRPAH